MKTIDLEYDILSGLAKIANDSSNHDKYGQLPVFALRESEPNQIINMETVTRIQAISTSVEKSRVSGWKATSYFQLPNNKRQLRVSTYKTNRGIQTNVQAVERGDFFESFVMFQDYHKVLKSFPDIKMATEKSITQAHNLAIGEIEAVITEADAFYAPKTV